MELDIYGNTNGSGHYKYKSLGIYYDESYQNKVKVLEVVHKHHSV